MTTFTTNPGVGSFETGGPNGELLRVEAGSPFSTDDRAVIHILETSGAHAVTSSDAAPAGVVDAPAPAEKTEVAPVVAETEDAPAEDAPETTRARKAHAVGGDS